MRYVTTIMQEYVESTLISNIEYDQERLSVDDVYTEELK